MIVSTTLNVLSIHLFEMPLKIVAVLLCIDYVRDFVGIIRLNPTCSRVPKP